MSETIYSLPLKIMKTTINQLEIIMNKIYISNIYIYIYIYIHTYNISGTVQRNSIYVNNWDFVNRYFLELRGLGLGKECFKLFRVKRSGVRRGMF